MTKKEQLKRSIKRSEKAYELYLEDKLYFQALRIFKANKIVYHLLEDFIFECEEAYVNQVFLYIFHLEDWFEVFERSKISQPSLDDRFVFERLKNSPSFPGDFIKNCLN